jgi:MbtH protein
VNSQQADKTKEPQYKVVLNDEEQYSIWPAWRAAPAGWHLEGTTGTEAECIRYIDEVWVDMRPRSVRLQVGQASRNDD